MTAEKSCADCHQTNCYREDRIYPKFCLTEALASAEREDTAEIYRGDSLDGRIARAAAEVEATYYGRLTRVEETVAFAHRIGAVKIGIATCVGLIEETRIFAEFLKRGGLEPYAVLCKVGAVDKTEIGLAEDQKIVVGGRESCCNPILQARLLNAHQTDLNVVVGLCVGHDSLFIRHSEAPVTVLLVKDRVLAHNPVAALYTVHSYMKRLADEERAKGL